MTHDEDATIADLTRRIATVREAITAAEKSREQRRNDAGRAATTELRQKIRDAEQRLGSIQEGRKPRPSPTLESSLRSGLYWAGAGLAIPGAFPLFFMIRERYTHPEEALEPSMIAVLAIPCLLGVVMLLRARFAKFRKDRQDLDGDFP